MKKLLIATIFICTTCFAGTISAQAVRGIRVECNFPVEVFLDGQQMSYPVQSSMICNIRPGNYLIEAYATFNDGSGEYRECVYRERIFYSGNRIMDVLIEDDFPTGGMPFYKQLLSDLEFNRFMETFRSASFDRDRDSILDIAAANSLFLTRQVATIAMEYSFDSARLPMLKKLYPAIVDKENVFQLLDVLTFSSSKREFADFVK